MEIQGVKIFLKWGLAKLPRLEHADADVTSVRKKNREYVSTFKFKNKQTIGIPGCVHLSG